MTSNRVNSTAKALKILDCFSPSQPELTLAQISRILDMPKSTLLIHLNTLQEAGYIVRSQDTQVYRLGYKILELNYISRASMPVIQYAIPFMEEIQEQTKEFVYLTSHVNGRVLYLECMYPSRRSVSYSVSGKTVPMHCTSSGKAMLSQMPTKQVEDIIKKHGLPPVTANTYTDYDAFFEELARSRARGYAVDNEEETLGVKCIAVAIRTSRGEVAGAMSISGSVLTMRDELREKYATLLSRACNALVPNANLFPAIQLSENSYQSY